MLGKYLIIESFLLSLTRVKSVQLSTVVDSYEFLTAHGTDGELVISVFYDTRN
jgi:hypothetical protein